MKKTILFKTMLLLCALIVGSSSAWADDLTIDFEESSTDSYSDWVFNNITTHQTNSNVTAHGGSYFGTTGGKATASLQTKSKIESPISITFYVSKQSTNTTACYWTVSVSSDGESWTQVGDSQSASSMSKGAWVEVTRDLSTYSDVYVKIDYANNTAIRCIDDVTLLYSSSSKQNVTLSFPEESYNADIAGGANSFTAPELSMDVEVDVTYSSSNEDVATVDEETGAVTLVGKGVTTITATFVGNDTYNRASASYTLTVTNSNAGDGSLEKPFTVVEAIEFIKTEDPDNVNCYVKGIISKISSTSVLSGGKLTYFISDDGTTTKQLQVYKGKNLNDTEFTAVSDIEVGDNVIIYGPLKYYNGNTPELNDGNYIYSTDHKTREVPELIVEEGGISMEVTTTKPVEDVYATNSDGAVTVSSRDESIVKVEDGLLKAVSVGSVTITVEVAQTDNFTAATAYFIATVTAENPVAPEGQGAGAGYFLVTDANTLNAGDKLLIVCESKNKVMTSQSGTKCDYADVTINNHAITNVPSDANVVTLESATDGKWYLSTVQGYLTSTAAKSIKVESETTNASAVSISIDEEDNATIDFGEGIGTLQYNASSPRFCTYTSSQTAIQIYRNQSASTFDIAVSAAGWRGLVTAVDATLPEGLTAYTVADNDGTTVTLNETFTVKANTPYIVKGNEGTYTLTVAEEEIEAPENNLLQISTQNTGNGVYVLYNGASGVGFYLWSGGSLGAGRVYLPAIVNAREFIGLDSETTGISTVNSEAKSLFNGEFFNMAGQCVAKPAKGLYIVNGKKVVIK